MHFKLHTIILLCGPSCCGKSWFAKTHLIPQLRSLQKGRPLNIQYVSSDELRCRVLGEPDLDLRDPANAFRLKYASAAAFRLLETTVEQVTSFPVNAEFVIVDSTALNDDFRMQMINIAVRNHYHVDLVLFDLPMREYYRYSDGDDYVSRHVRRFHREVLPNLKSRYYHQILRVKDRENFSPVEAIDGLDLFERCCFPDEAVIAGDLHGCFDALLKIERDAGDLPIIPIGDVIDKGPDSLGILRHLRANPEKYPRLILGNHEGYVYRYLNGKIDESPAHDYYTSIPQYGDDAEYRELIDWYFETAVPFVKMRDGLYVTHAPCENRYIGKVDHVAMRRQRYRPVTDDLPDSLHAEADDSLPRHVFGHTAFERPFRFRNKFGIDTGGVYGNMFSFYKQGRIAGFPTEKAYSQNALIEVVGETFDMSELEYGELRRIALAIEDKINFVSGTIAPCASDVERGKIEPIEKALATFRSAGINVVHVQKKYMGSRCEAYISRDVSQCRLTSRNGYRIRRLHNRDGNDITDFTAIYEAILAQPKIAALFGQYPDAETLLLDGELMPWYAMGKGLIETQYRLIDRAVQSEYDMLREAGFERVLQAELESEAYKLCCESPNVPDSAVNSNKKTTCKLLKNYRHVPLDEMEGYLQTYREQVAIYGSPREIEYCPFDILKIVNADGSEKLFRDVPVRQRYDWVARDEGLLVDLTDDAQVSQLISHFENLPADAEGFVIKCNAPGRSRVNALKVRNEKYLTIIYGYDYLEPSKNAALINKKSINRKLAVSNREYELGWDLAAIPRNQINDDNEQYKQTLAGLIFEERKETVLDPRL